MRRTASIVCFLLAGWLLAAPGARAQKDYLTDAEADKIRDAEMPSQRIKLFVGFADDRLKKFKYELERPVQDRRKNERMIDLMNAYASLMDDAAELVDLGLEKSQDIRAGVKELQAKGKECLAYLEKLAEASTETTFYKDSLDDAIVATKDALADAEKALKEIAPPPVRRKP